MKNSIVILMFFCCYLISGQNIDFSELNSSNVLHIVNTVNQHTTMNTSKTAVIQIGNSNSTSVYDRSKKSDILIRQTGNYNNTLMTNTNPELENQQKVNVQGDNNYIDITGNNSNSKEMQINVKANDKMIFVRHY